MVGPCRPGVNDGRSAWWGVRQQDRLAERRLALPAVQEAIAAIPRLPVYASDILAKLVDERAHADEAVEAIRNDPALAALVLKAVKSAC